jgi:hypothetical protein
MGMLCGARRLSGKYGIMLEPPGDTRLCRGLRRHANLQFMLSPLPCCPPHAARPPSTPVLPTQGTAVLLLIQGQGGPARAAEKQRGRRAHLDHGGLARAVGAQHGHARVERAEERDVCAAACMQLKTVPAHRQCPARDKPQPSPSKQVLCPQSQSRYCCLRQCLIR